MIHVVTGHVCSGKTTYVREHARAGDIVIDMDAIASTLTHQPTGTHDHTQQARDVAMAARLEAIKASIVAHRRSGYGRTDAEFDVWIVHAYPDDKDESWYRSLGADVVRMTATDGELISRAERQRPARCVNELLARLKR